MDKTDELRKAVCQECGQPLIPAPARVDGELTYIGYFPCRDHPQAGVRYPNGLGVQKNTMPEWFSGLCDTLEQK